MKVKWSILFLIWLMMLVAYFDRVNISVAGPTISRALGFSATQFGLVLSAFTLGYAVLQIPGGRLADRFGAKPLLVAALLMWSLFTGATGLVTGFAILLIIRVLFGVGEGLENGAQFKLIGDNFQPEERSRANAIFLSTLALGPAIATPCAAWILQHQGWRELFYYSAGLGFAVALLLYVLLPNPAKTLAPLQGKLDLRQPQLWVCAGAYLLFNGAFWGFIGWIPSYLTETRHLTLSKLGLLGAVPYLCGFLAMLAVGQLGSASFFHRKSLLLGVCYLGAAASLFFALNAGTLAGAITGLSAAAACLYGSFGPFWAVAIDLTTAGNRGGLTGFINFGGQIGGFVAQIVIGKLFDMTHSFAAGLSYMIVCLVLSAVAASAIRPANLNPASPVNNLR